MKKALACLLAVLAVPALSAAAGFKFGLVGGFAMPSESDYSGAPAFGIVFNWDASKYIGLEIRGLMSSYDVAGEVEDGLSKGKISTIPIMAALTFRYPVTEKIAPYAAVGAGYCINSFTLDSGIEGDWADVGIAVEESLDSAFGFQVGGGVEVALTPKFAIALDVRYLISKAAGAWSFTDTASDESVDGTLDNLKLDALVLSLGVKVIF